MRRRGRRWWLLLPILFAVATAALAQPAPAAAPGDSQKQPVLAGLGAWKGAYVQAIEFRGVPKERLEPLPSRLAQQPGEPLDPDKVRQSLRRLYSTGQYRSIEVKGVRRAGNVTLIFDGQPQLFLGRVTVTGVKSDQLTTLFERATKLNAGTVYSDARMEQADQLLARAIEENGYFKASTSRQVKVDAEHAQADILYLVSLDGAARVGDIAVSGDSGMSVSTFRKKSKLKKNSRVDRETVGRALTGLRKHYQKKDRLEADVSLESQEFRSAANLVDYSFKVNQGPIDKVVVNGARLSSGKVRKLVPIYEEGAVDEDLLNEGNRNLRDYFQRKGYFDVKVKHRDEDLDATHARVSFDVELGPLHRVDSVEVAGNKYFHRDTLQEHLAVRKADAFDRHGLYSQSLVNADVGSITALYQSNGFTRVKVTPAIKDSDQLGRSGSLAHLQVIYQVEEGTQQKIGRFDIHGANRIPDGELRPLLNTQVGQPYSPANVAGDRDQVLAYYLSHGFEQVQVQLLQKDDPADSSLVNLAMDINEGEQVFVRNVLISGLHYTRPHVVDRQVRIHAGDALDESALLETQRRLYDLALFNEVGTAVQNPTGDELRKNVLLQLTEARRWDLNYGFGFEAQTGTPSRSCPSPAELIQLGIDPSKFSCSPNGKTGVSPRVLFDVTRTNLGGRDQSISIRTSYGTLEKRATFIFQSPKLFNSPNLDFSFSGGYTDTQDVTTYAASRLEGSLRLTERFLTEGSWFNRAHTFIYEFTYRRVKVDPNSIQVSPDQIPLLSQSVRVGGPGITWIRDTRDAPLDAHRGTYTSVQNFLAYDGFGSQADFYRLDATNSSYHAYGKRRWVLARSTRLGYERAFGVGTIADIPLPERLYAGGGTSHRGFSINAAGPRDPQTGFPVGGAAAFVNSTEFRLPNPSLPYVGNSLGFVFFHDMGNVFTKSSDIWPSIFRVTQPHSDTCRVLPPNTGTGTPSGPSIPRPSESAKPAPPQPEGGCSFNYFSHAPGIGLRYQTPIGPIRVDFSYNLNPPIYPVILDAAHPAAPPHVGQASHFNFFFSIGQSF